MWISQNFFSLLYAAEYCMNASNLYVYSMCNDSSVLLCGKYAICTSLEAGLYGAAIIWLWLKIELKLTNKSFLMEAEILLIHNRTGLLETFLFLYYHCRFFNEISQLTKLGTHLNFKAWSSHPKHSLLKVQKFLSCPK